MCACVRVEGGGQINVFNNCCYYPDVTLGNNVTSGFTLSTDPRAFIFTDVDVPEGIITAISFFSTGINLAIKFQIWDQMNDTEYLLAAQIRYVTSAVGVQEVMCFMCVCVCVCVRLP